MRGLFYICKAHSGYAVFSVLHPPVESAIAIFLSCARTMVRVVEESRHPIGGVNSFPLKPDSMPGLRRDTSEAYYKIKLRLNANQKDLLTGLDAARTAVQKYISGEFMPEAALEAVDKAGNKVGEVLKSEWEKVKSGETAYKSALKTTLISVTIGAMMAAGLLI